MNRPSFPFETPFKVSMTINFDSQESDLRRLQGEAWCWRHTTRPWFRKVFAGRGRVEFHFEDLNEATLFWLAN